MTSETVMSLEDSYGEAPWYADESWAGFRAVDLTVPEDVAPPTDPNEIERVLEKAALQMYCNAFTGDCPAVAGALARFFDADALVWLVNNPGDPWPIHALVRKGEMVFDAKGERSREDLRQYLENNYDDPDPLEEHLEEHDPAEFEIVEETALAQQIIDERLVPVVRDGANWKNSSSW